LTPAEPIRATLPLSLITKGDNPRRYFDRKKHDELVASIRLRGILQPILLRPKGEVYAIVAGERRYRAGLEAYGPDGEVPVIIREMTDQEALDAAIAENDDRDDPSETEQADAAVRYLAACQNDRTEAARRLGWSRSKLDRRLALAELSDAVKLALDERRIKVGHAELLAAVPGDKQDKALETILAAELDVGKTRELLMRVTQNLAAACFDKTECTTCPFNSASQRTLFETHVDDGHCTNPGCFELKTQTAEAIRFEEQERAEKAARAAALPSTDDPQGGERDDDDDGGLDDTETETDASPVDRTEPRAPAPLPSASGGSAAHKPTVTVKSIAGRTSDLREAKWRTAVARPSRPMPSMPIPPFSSPPCRARFPDQGRDAEGACRHLGRRHLPGLALWRQDRGNPRSLRAASGQCALRRRRRLCQGRAHLRACRRPRQGLRG
jgi:ParB/RepB/Spo0J family partition protein